MHRKILYIYLSECIGTALLVGVGLSVVIFNNGEGSPIKALLPSPGWRRALTGFLFGTTGCLITLSPIGRISGAHINPIVSLAFRLKKRMSTPHTLGFIIAQLTGCIIGALPLLLWGRQGASVGYGATVPLPDPHTLPLTGHYASAFIGELITSFLLVAGIFFFTGHKRLRRFTPFLTPPLYCLMVYAEGPLSGTSTNPARTLGPAIISGWWTGHWIYWIAPICGALLGVLLFKMPVLKWWTILPKLFHPKRPAANTPA
jgi:aquaporin Z